jgi:cobalt-zinc-cadmium efflux system membrane fusion protein
MRHQKFLTVLFTVVWMAVLTTCGTDPQSGQHQGEDIDAEEDHAGHDNETDHEEARVVLLEPEELQELGIALEEAGPARIVLTTELPGEVRLNTDRSVHIVPRVGGIVREVFKSLGDRVRAGEVLAVLDSRELADAKASYLAARERLVLADSTFQREQRLWNKKVSSEGDFLNARNAQAEARIALRSAQQKLLALGFSQEHLREFPNQHGGDFIHYELTAPFEGTVIEKHITLGETLAADTTVFVIADVSTVWIDISVYQKDLGRVRAGQQIVIRSPHGDPEISGSIDFVQPLVGEETRTALARVILQNRDGRWHPGCFVTARVAVESFEVPVAVPLSALQQIEGVSQVVFVLGEEGFEPRSITVGRSDSKVAEILSGLERGERFAATNTFAIKAELGKESFGGHVH